MIGITIASLWRPAFHRSTAMLAISKKPMAKELSLSHGPPMIAVLRQSSPSDETRESIPGVIDPACPGGVAGLHHISPGRNPPATPPSRPPPPPPPTPAPR